MNAPSSDKSAISLSTGEFRRSEVEAGSFGGMSVKQADWLTSWGGDLISVTNRDKKLIGVGANFRGVDVSTGAFENLSPEEVDGILMRSELKRSVSISILGVNELRTVPQTWAFRSHDGARGLMQLIKVDVDSVAVRYKLIQDK